MANKMNLLILTILLSSCNVSRNNVEVKIDIKNCTKDTLVNFYSGDRFDTTGPNYITDKLFEKKLDRLVEKMNFNFELTNSETVFAIELANSMIVMNNEYTGALKKVFTKLEVFLEKWESTYIEYVKCNHDYFNVKSSGIYFPYLLIQYGGSAYSCRYLFVDFNKNFDVCNSTILKVNCAEPNGNSLILKKRDDIKLD